MSLIHTCARIANDLGLSALGQRIRSQQSVILCFHRFCETAEDRLDPSQYVSVEHAARIIARLQALGFIFVPLEDLLTGEERTGRRAAITVDDGFRDFASLGVPLFVRLNVPATLFVSPGFTTGQTLSWWAVAEHLVTVAARIVWEHGERRTELDCSTLAGKRHAFMHIRKCLDRSVDAQRSILLACREAAIEPTQVMNATFLPLDTVREISGQAGIDIGSHSMTHPSLARLHTADALAELNGSKSWLEAELGRQVTSFAYPYGAERDCGPREAALARQCGYRVAVTTRPGLVGKRADPFLLPRLEFNARDESLAYIDFSLSGLKTIATWCRQAVRFPMPLAGEQM